MIPQFDIEYSLEREMQEREAAAVAVYPGAQAIHVMLAEQYADRAWGAREAMCEASNAR